MLYTDGLTEAVNGADTEYGTDRLVGVLDTLHGRDPVHVVAESLRDLRRFSGAAPRSDDLAVMALRRG